jgi:hypothetical protein
MCRRDFEQLAQGWIFQLGWRGDFNMPEQLAGSFQ